MGMAFPGGKKQNKKTKKQSLNFKVREGEINKERRGAGRPKIWKQEEHTLKEKEMEGGPKKWIQRTVEPSLGRWKV